LERGPWSIHEDGGSIQPSGRRIDDEQGCPRSSREEGSLHPRRPAAAGGGREGPSLRATRPARSSVVVQRPSPQAVVGSRRRPQAASRSGGGFRGLVLRRACSAVRPASKGLSRLVALAILLREGKVARPNSLANARADSRSLRKRDARTTDENRVLGSVSVRRKCSCRSRWAAV
jgi:hypothetical protein